MSINAETTDLADIVERSRMFGSVIECETPSGNQWHIRPVWFLSRDSYAACRTDRDEGGIRQTDGLYNLLRLCEPSVRLIDESESIYGENNG